MKIIIFFITLLQMFGLFSCIFFPHETTGQYAMNCINSEANRNKDKEKYFYADNNNIYCYFLENGEKKLCLNIDMDTGYVISDFAIYDTYIYYAISNGNVKELRRVNYQTGEQQLLLSHNDLIQFNEEKELETNDYVCVDVYDDYVFFAIVGEHEYMCPIEGNIKEDSFNLHTLFEVEDKSGNIQQVIYDGIVIERYAISSGQYKISNIRDLEGYKILYSNMWSCVKI